MGLKQWLPVVVLISFGILILLDPTEGKKSKRKEEDEAERPNRITIDSDRSKLFAGLQDPETSAQAINPAIQNPLLYQNQGGLGVGGGLANLGGGVFQNQGGLNGNYLNGYQNPYLSRFGSGGIGGLGGYGGVGGIGGYGGLGGLGGGYGGLGGYGGYGGIGGIGGVDIYTQGALAAQLYNNPLYGAGAGTLTGAAAGINPLLLRGAQNQQYPIVGGLGAYNPYLAAQALLSPYSNYNQLGNYPFSSRFGIGAGSTGRSALNRYNSQSNSNSDE